jgi:hypothetical protein
VISVRVALDNGTSAGRFVVSLYKKYGDKWEVFMSYPGSISVSKAGMAKVKMDRQADLTKTDTFIAEICGLKFLRALQPILTFRFQESS